MTKDLLDMKNAAAQDVANQIGQIMGTLIMPLFDRPMELTLTGRDPSIEDAGFIVSNSKNQLADFALILEADEKQRKQVREVIHAVFFTSENGAQTRIMMIDKIIAAIIAAGKLLKPAPDQPLND